MKKLTKYIGILISPFIVGYIIVVFLIPSFIDINISQTPESQKIYDTNKKLIGHKLAKDKYRHTHIDLKDIPDFTKKAIIKIEDQSFWENNGIDYLALLRATKNNIQAGRIVQGGSTISSQLIRNAYRLNKPRSYTTKAKEFIMAIALNNQYTKNQILEKYLNSINFGYLNYGIQSASQFYFNKSIQNTTRGEQLALLTTPKNPSKYNPIKNYESFKQRYLKLAKHLYKNGTINQQDYKLIKNEKINFDKNTSTYLPYIQEFIDKYKLTNNGSNIPGIRPIKQNPNILKNTNQIDTTIDYNLTEQIHQIGSQTIDRLKKHNVNDFGVLIVDRQTNNIKTMIGGKNYYSENGQVNAVTSTRQVGSTLKPFAYLLYLKQFNKEITDTVLDLPEVFKTNLGYAYQPHNFDLTYRGKVSLATALAQSLNMPAVKITKQIGVDNLLYFLRKLGISSLNNSSSHYGLSLVLGSGDISLYELLRAYSIFANKGFLCDFNILQDQPNDCKEIIDSVYTDKIVNILSNRYYSIGSFPLYTSMDFPDRFVFKKSGTSRDFTDNHIVGFTDSYLIGVWVGNKDGKPMQSVSSASGAGRIFQDIVYKLEKQKYNPNSPQVDTNSQKYLQVTSPLNTKVYQTSTNIPKNKQKIKINYVTNIPHEKAQYYINNKQTSKKYINLYDYIGSNSLEVKLIQNEKTVQTQKINFTVKQK